MILTHYTIINDNDINNLIEELEKINDGYTELYINSVYTNKNNKIILEIDEHKVEDLVKIKGF